MIKKRETKERLDVHYLRAMIDGHRPEIFSGIMRSRDCRGNLNLPYAHQRRLVKRFASSSTKMLLGGHDCGLGKTASALQAYAAQALMLNRRPKMVISAPSSTLDQWYDSVADWIRVDPKHVMVTSRLRDITKEALKDVDILILTRDCLSRAFSESFQKYEQHSQVQTGVGLRWISRWDRKGGVSTPNGVVWPPENSVELNALFNPTWAPPKSTTGRGSAPPKPKPRLGR